MQTFYSFIFPSFQNATYPTTTTSSSTSTASGYRVTLTQLMFPLYFFQKNQARKHASIKTIVSSKPYVFFTFSNILLLLPKSEYTYTYQQNKMSDWLIGREKVSFCFHLAYMSRQCFPIHFFLFFWIQLLHSSRKKILQVEQWQDA